MEEKIKKIIEFFIKQKNGELTSETLALLLTGNRMDTFFMKDPMFIDILDDLAVINEVVFTLKHTKTSWIIKDVETFIKDKIEELKKELSDKEEIKEEFFKYLKNMNIIDDSGKDEIEILFSGELKKQGEMIITKFLDLQDEL